MKIKVEVTRNPIRCDKIIRSVASNRSGGLVIFFGTVRSASRGMRVQGISIESAKDLAKADIRRICTEAEKRFDFNDVVVSHRVGHLKVGETIVAIAVGAAHRKSAFRACEFIIDELKKTTPIWKKEIGYGKVRWA